MNVHDMITTMIGREGGYANHPADHGGETMWGITVSVARAFGYRGEMKDMPRDAAECIYLERYWRQPGLQLVNDINPAIAEEMLDTGVNMGSAVAVRFLQRALNVLAGPALEVDGSLGKVTLSALSVFLKVRGADGEKVLLRMLNAQQSVRYIELAEAATSQEQFEFGWQLNRVGAL